MQLRSLPVIARPIAGSSQRRARLNAQRALIVCQQRRREREDVEAFLTRVLPEQRRRNR